MIVVRLRALPKLIEGHPVHHWAGRLHARARKGKVNAARAAWKLASSRRRWRERHGVAFFGWPA